MTMVLEALLALVAKAAASAGPPVIGEIISTLTTWTPEIVKAGKALVQPVRNIIAALSVNPETLPAQIAQLQALDAQCDAAFDAADAKAAAEDAAMGEDK